MYELFISFPCIFSVDFFRPFLILVLRLVSSVLISTLLIYLAVVFSYFDFNIIPLVDKFSL